MLPGSSATRSVQSCGTSGMTFTLKAGDGGIFALYGISLSAGSGGRCPGHLHGHDGRRRIRECHVPGHECVGL